MKKYRWNCVSWYNPFFFTQRPLVCTLSLLRLQAHHGLLNKAWLLMNFSAPALWLVLWRTQLQFPAPLSSPASVTPVMRESDTLFWPQRVVHMYVNLESPCRIWDLNLGPLEEKPVFLTLEPSLQPCVWIKTWSAHTKITVISLYKKALAFFWEVHLLVL